MTEAAAASTEKRMILRVSSLHRAPPAQCFVGIMFGVSVSHHVHRVAIYVSHSQFHLPLTLFNQFHEAQYFIIKINEIFLDDCTHL